MEGKREHFGGKPAPEKRITLEQVTKRETPSVFTSTQHELMSLYRDGANEEDLKVRGFGKHACRDLWKDIAERYRNSFIKNPGRTKSFAALGTAIAAGWIDTRDFSREPTPLEEQVGSFMMKGFSVEQAARIRGEEMKVARRNMEKIKNELGIQTDYEAVAWFAGSIRKNQLQKKNRT